MNTTANILVLFANTFVVRKTDDLVKLDHQLEVLEVDMQEVEGMRRHEKA